MLIGRALSGFDWVLLSLNPELGGNQLTDCSKPDESVTTQFAPVLIYHSCGCYESAGINRC